MPEFKVGDVVRLKSGGPVMTVDKVEEEGRSLFCVWFDERGTQQTSNFFAATLEPAKPPTGTIPLQRA